MATSTLFLILIAVLIAACIIYSFASKLSGAIKGKKLIIDNDTVTVADDEIQDFIAEVESIQESKEELKFTSNVKGNAVA